MLFTFLLIVHAIVAATLVTVILMQRSEGGGLGMGGSPSGLMSARGAADFLTRATTILATLFVAMSIGLAALATYNRAPRTIDTSLAKTAPAGQTPTSDVPLAGDPLAPVAGAVSTNPGPTTPEAPAGEAIPPAAAKAVPATTAAIAPESSTTSTRPNTRRTATPKPPVAREAGAGAPAAVIAPGSPPGGNAASAPTLPSTPPPVVTVPAPVLEKTVPTPPGNAASPQ